MARSISLQPHQYKMLEMMESKRGVWIGVGGGRGAAKSAGADRIAVALSTANPGIVSCIVMRNYDQVRRYHIEPILRAFPELESYYNKSEAKVRMPVGDTVSEIDFSYAESLSDVERRFRSANYKYIIVDQAEQFTDVELREMKNACRWPGGGAKILLLFNMGGIGIQALRKWFHTREFNEREDPDDYVFLHVYPWDNVEWSRDALAEDGLSVSDYYSWTSEERMDYCASRSDYGKTLNSLDDSLRARDWLGSWDSLEGAYFGRVFDRDATMIAPAQAQALIQPWDMRALSTDWGKAHYCVTYWHGVTHAGPERVKSILGWDVDKPLTIAVTYRELVTQELTSHEVANAIVMMTPEGERQKIKRYPFSPDAFGEKDSEKTIAINFGDKLAQYGMAIPEQADNSRQIGWQLQYGLHHNTKLKGAGEPDVWLISSDCPELMNAIPLLMRDPKNLDDVMKTDKGMARLEQDCADSARYFLQTILDPRKTKPYDVREEEYARKFEDPTQRAIRVREFQLKHKPKGGVKRWRGNGQPRIR